MARRMRNLFPILATVAAVAGCDSKPKYASDFEASEGETSMKTQDQPAPDTTESDSRFVLRYTMNRIDGTPEALGDYKGDVVLIVNTASECGLTGQYEGLEALYRQKKDEGFVVLGFPANQFMGQEPGSNEKIAEFCSTKYDISFPMFEKIVVKGEGVHPLYEQLAALPDGMGGEPEWNFQKFLVDRSGRVVARFSPRTKPDDAELVAAIDKALAAR